MSLSGIAIWMGGLGVLGYIAYFTITDMRRMEREERVKYYKGIAILLVVSALLFVGIKASGITNLIYTEKVLPMQDVMGDYGWVEQGQNQSGAELK